MSLLGGSRIRGMMKAASAPGFGRSPTGVPKSLRSYILSLQANTDHDCKNQNDNSHRSPGE
jgi:hypothetical protein